MSAATGGDRFITTLASEALDHARLTYRDLDALASQLDALATALDCLPSAASDAEACIRRAEEVRAALRLVDEWCGHLVRLVRLRAAAATEDGAG